MSLILLASLLFSCATPPVHQSLATANELDWIAFHGGCDCDPVAFAAGSASPSWLGTQTLATYVRETSSRCPSQRFAIVSSGDGSADFAADARLARARALRFVRLLSARKRRRVDTIVLAGLDVRHASTLSLACLSEPLPTYAPFRPHTSARTRSEN